MQPHVQFGQPAPFNNFQGQPNMAQQNPGQNHSQQKNWKKGDKKDKSAKIDKKFVKKESPSKQQAAAVEAK